MTEPSCKCVFIDLGFARGGIAMSDFTDDWLNEEDGDDDEDDDW